MAQWKQRRGPGRVFVREFVRGGDAEGQTCAGLIAAGIRGEESEWKGGVRSDADSCAQLAAGV